MITEVDRYQGAVLRQLLVSIGRPVELAAVNLSGRLDAFCLERAAFQVKYSSKRLSPWRFSYIAENLRELEELGTSFDCVWAILVCGLDGIVALSFDEMESIIQVSGTGSAWIRVSRGRNSMYRVGGSRGDLPRAKPRGLEPFVERAVGAAARVERGS